MHSVCFGLSPSPPTENKEQSDEAGPQAGSVQSGLGLCCWPDFLPGVLLVPPVRDSKRPPGQKGTVNRK